MSNDQRWGLYVLSRLLAPFSNNAWFLTSSVIMLSAVTLGCLYLWQQHHEAILNQPGFRLSESQLSVTPQPDWISTADVKADALLRGSLIGANIRDDDFSLRIARAFQNNPWVREVKLVNKSQARGRGIVVELEYRRPAAVVIVDAREYGLEFSEGLLPIDDEAFLLPQELSKEFANEYPKIGEVGSRPISSRPMGVGHPWGDPRVLEAAQIAALLREMWHDLGLLRLDVPTVEDAKINHGYFQLVLVTGETKPWGRAPGKEAPGEPSAAEKIAILRQILNQPDAETARAMKELSLLELRWATRK